jgi:DNA helicase HerA-like ATPase
MTALHIGTTTTGEPFTLPLEAQTVAFAIVGRRGSGKTNLAVVMVEEMVAAGLAVCILDVLGVWWGLRSSADGEGEGLPVTILGGSHGDLPIEPASGPLIANYVVENPGAYVVDLSAFASKAEEDRFAADFAHQLYRRKATNNAALHLVIRQALPHRSAAGAHRRAGGVA